MPKPGRGLREFDAYLSPSSLKRAYAGHAARSFVPSLRVHEQNSLSEGHFCSHYHQRPMVVYGQCGRFFLKGLVIRRLSADHERHLGGQTGATAPFGEI